MIEAEKKLWEAFVNLYSEASALRNNTTLPASFLEALDTVDTCERQLRLSTVVRTGIRQVGEGR
jgi:hypothetical protein